MGYISKKVAAYGQFVRVFFIFFFISSRKSVAWSRIFRNGLPKDILSKGQKSMAGGRIPPSLKG